MCFVFFSLFRLHQIQIIMRHNFKQKIDEVLNVVSSVNCFVLVCFFFPKKNMFFLLLPNKEERREKLNPNRKKHERLQRAITKT